MLVKGAPDDQAEGLCNMGCPSETHLIPKSRQISFAHNLLRSYRFAVLHRVQPCHYHALCKISNGLEKWRYPILHKAPPSYASTNYGLLCVMFTFHTKIFYRGVSSFATDYPCAVWWRGLTTCLLYVGSPFVNLIVNDNGFVSLT